MKKFILTESQIKYLKEHIRQLHIPFEEFGGDERGKVPYEYYMDYIESIGQYGTLKPKPFDKKNALEEMEESITYLINMFAAQWDFYSDNESFIKDNIIKHPEYFKDVNKFKNFYYNTTDTNQSMNIQDFNNFFCASNDLTDIGKKAYFIFYAGDDCFISELLDDFDFNEKGQVYVERIVSLKFDPLKYPQTKRYIINGYQHIYSSLIRNHPNIGTYWSWKKGNINDFHDSNWFELTENSFIFKGYVNLCDVIWIDTITKNFFLFPEEHELTLKENSIVQVNEIIWFETGQKLPLKQPILIKT